LLLGVFWTIRGYESYDGDQAYRLPLLFARQDPALYAHDRFVAALGEFNPHAGWLWVLDFASRPLGLAAGMVGLYVLVFAAVGWSVSRMARVLLPSVRGAGIWAFVFFLCARAGNIGTNHLFDSVLLDRQVVLAAGWVLLARWVCLQGRLRAAEWLLAAVGLAFASWIHPGLGLQLCGLFGVMHLVWGCLERREVGAWTRVVGGLTACCVGACPALLFAWNSSGTLLGGVDSEVFRLLAVEIQGPQHLAPWLWRTDQWAAAAAYLVLAWFGIADAVHLRHEGGTGVGWRRIVSLFVCGVILLAIGWIGVAVMRDLRITLFQPFRLATVLRGVALLLAAPSFARLWNTGGPWERLRVVALACGLGFDQTLVVVVTAELAARAWLPVSQRGARGVWLVVILCGLVHLSAHDPQG
jgi:hypothetical protein